MGEFLSNYLAESGHRVPLCGQISMNGSVECLGIPEFHRTVGLFWSANLLAPHFRWVDGGTSTNQNWVIQPGGSYGSVSTPRRGAISACPD